MKYFLSTLLAFVATLAQAQNYPATKKTPKEVSNHGISYTDDYTWLENMQDKEVIAWVNAQNKIADSHIDGLPTAMAAYATIKKYQSQTRYRMPVIKGKYFYSRMYGEGSSSLYYREALDGRPIELVDPNFFYSGKTVTISNYEPSKNSTLLAYTVSVNGSDLNEMRFVTIKSGKKHDDIIRNLKFSNIAWKNDEGVFYKKSSNASQFAVDSLYKVYYHKLGTLEADDKLVYEGKNATRSNVDFFTSQSGDKLFIEEYHRADRTIQYYYADLTTSQLKLEEMPADPKKPYEIAGIWGNRVYIKNDASNWGDLRYFELENPTEIKAFIPQTQNQVLANTWLFKDRIICEYYGANGDYLMVYGHDGKFVKKVQAPKGTSITVYPDNFEAEQVFFTITSYTVPPILFTLNLLDGAYDRYNGSGYKKPTSPFGVDHFETKETFYTSRDGVQIPLTLVYKKGTVFNGNNPLLLEAYGGFGLVASKYYDNGLVYFLEKGGVFAYAHIRGGGEGGKSWHKQGKKRNKINCLNDFIDAAEFLIREKYTSANRLGITGGSHGGLVVGHALVMRPELFKVVISKMGVYDMAIKHNYTNGLNTSVEYGDPGDPEDYKAMIDYSPYKNIKEEVNYPTVLLITGDNDDRVPPLHSYKFAAKLQNRPAQKNPVYLRTLAQSGHHGESGSYDEVLEEMADQYAFLLYHLMK